MYRNKGRKTSQENISLKEHCLLQQQKATAGYQSKAALKQLPVKG